MREQQGLAYSVYSAPNGYRNIGTLNIFLNISETNTLRSLEAVKKELDAFKRGGITEEELNRTKVQLKSALVFAGESVQSVMSSCGKLMLLKNEVYDVDERIALIDGVTKKQVERFAARVFDYSGLNAAYVGKKTDTDILGSICEIMHYSPKGENMDKLDKIFEMQAALGRLHSRKQEFGIY